MVDIGSVQRWFSDPQEKEAPKVARPRQGVPFSVKPSAFVSEASSALEKAVPTGLDPVGVSGGVASVSPQLAQVTEAAEMIQAQVSKLAPEVSVSVDRDTDILVVRVMDNKTGELIRQIPTQEVVDLAAKMDRIVGLIFDKKG